MPFSSLKIYAMIMRNEHKIIAASKNNLFKNDHLAAELIRNTHSIEKGLCIAKPRLGFGHSKQAEMMEILDILRTSDDSYHRETCQMAVSALMTYVDYHDKQGYNDEFIAKMKDYLKEFQNKDTSSGGVIKIKRESLSFDTENIENFFKTRHSIRDFSDVPVDNDTIMKALALAQSAPSACNRQGVRAYVLSHERSLDLAKTLPGIGGFEKSVDRFIMITGKTSAYRINEVNQYIVSASIYAAYLTMTLHLYRIGACVVQRPVVWYKKWNETRKKLNIPSDEQIVLMLAIGNLNEEFNVPLSHRLDISEIARFID